MDAAVEADDSPPPLLKDEGDGAELSEKACSGDDGGSDGEEEEVLEWWKDEGVKRCSDPFSNKTFANASECMNYCKNVHGFDLRILRRRHCMDELSFIRLVNYLRLEKPSPGFVMSLSSDCQWKDDKFLKPVLEDDPLLMFDVNDDLGNGDEDEDEDCNATGATPPQQGSVTITQAEHEEMRNEIFRLRSMLESKNIQLEEALFEMDQMRTVTKRLLMDDDSSLASLETTEGRGSTRGGMGTTEKSVSACVSEDEDQNYASSYAHFGIHHEMLSDKVRTESYRDAVALNVSQISGKNVLDLGCGTGILSMFCAGLGKSQHVVGVDMSDIVYQAMDIVMENGLADRITVLKGRLEDVDLRSKLRDLGRGGRDEAKFDVLISEWMGYFLLFEGMLDSVISARDSYLTSKPLILPNRFSMHLVGISDVKRYGETADYFGDVYGFKMSCLRKPLIAEASIEVVAESDVATTSSKIHELDVNTCTVRDTEFEATFELQALRECYLTSVAGYFDTFFDLNTPVSFSTGPKGPATHWKQTVFYLDRKIRVHEGENLTGSIRVRRPPKDVRSLVVTLTLNGRNPQTFAIN